MLPSLPSQMLPASLAPAIIAASLTLTGHCHGGTKDTSPKSCLCISPEYRSPPEAVGVAVQRKEADNRSIPGTGPSVAQKERIAPPLSPHSSTPGQHRKTEQRVAHSDQLSGRLHIPSLCKALPRSWMTQSTGPRHWCFCLKLLSRGQCATKPGKHRRRTPRSRALDTSGSRGDYCPQHSKVPTVGQSREQTLPQSVLPIILKDKSW